jgi:hypothetical protein
VRNKIYKILDEIGYFDKWRAEARAEMIVDILSRRLKLPSKTLQKKIYSVKNIDKLYELTDCAWTCVSLKEFSTVLQSVLQ